MPESLITEEVLARFRQRIGKWQVANPWNESAHRDAIRQFARCIGDTNPLWSDPAYAAGTRWGGLIAPPFYLYTCDRGEGLSAAHAGGLPGVQAFWAGDSWEWFAPVREGDEALAYMRITDLVEKASRHAGRMFDQWAEAIYVNQRGEVVARRRTLAKRFEKSRVEAKASGDGQEKKAPEPYHRPVYTPEMLKKLDQDYQAEAIRGATPCYWEDVQEGEPMQLVVKGPLTITEEIAWYCGAGAPLGLASKVRWLYFQKRPGANIPDPDTHVPDVPERIHWESKLGRAFGGPDLFDVGVQRVSWLGHIVTNWMGDDAWLWKMDAQTRKLNVWGDTQWCKGKVTRKYVEAGRCLVECEVWCENQRGEITAPGRATIIVPSRKHGPALLPTPPHARDLDVPTDMLHPLR